MYAILGGLMSGGLKSGGLLSGGLMSGGLMSGGRIHVLVCAVHMHTVIIGYKMKQYLKKS